MVDKRRHDLRQQRGGEVMHHPLGKIDNDKQVVEAISNDASPEMVLIMVESVESFFSHLGAGQLRDLADAKL